MDQPPTLWRWLKTVELATVHPGDSDTTAAIVGGFLGCMGIQPPDGLQARIDALDVIERLCQRYTQQESTAPRDLLS